MLCGWQIWMRKSTTLVLLSSWSSLFAFACCQDLICLTFWIWMGKGSRLQNSLAGWWPKDVLFDALLWRHWEYRGCSSACYAANGHQTSRPLFSPLCDTLTLCASLVCMQTLTHCALNYHHYLLLESPLIDTQECLCLWTSRVSNIPLRKRYLRSCLHIDVDHGVP